MGCAISVPDGPLWQWDAGRRARVEAPGATYVAFAPAGSARALTVAVEGGWAGVPDALLQSGADVDAWATDGRRALAHAVLPVRPRAKPDGYIYAPGEVQTWEDIRDWVRGELEGAGEPGTKWYVGEGGPSIGGRVGDLYLDSSTGRYYRYGEKEQ